MLQPGVSRKRFVRWSLGATATLVALLIAWSTLRPSHVVVELKPGDPVASFQHGIQSTFRTQYLLVNSDGQDALFSTFGNGLGTVGNLWIGGGGQSFSGPNTPGTGNNTSVGIGAMQNATTAFGSTAVGYQALNVFTTGYTTTAIGYGALSSDTSAVDNTAVGYLAAINVTTGCCNTAIGVETLSADTTGTGNVAVGLSAGQQITTGTDNVAVGRASFCGTTGTLNTCVGSQAGGGVQGSTADVAIGPFTLQAATSSDGNVAVGSTSLTAVTSGATNTAVGIFAATGVTTGSNTVAVGNHAIGTGGNVTNDTAIGAFALQSDTAGFNVAVGYLAATTITTGVANTVIGYNDTTGITTGNGNTIIGSNVGGLAGGLTNNIIIADGSGNIRIQSDSAGVVSVPQKFQVGTVAVPATAIFYLEDDSTTDTTAAWFVTQGTNHVGTGGNNEQIPIVIRNTTNFDTTTIAGHATGIDIAVTGGIALGANSMESVGIAIAGHCSTGNCTTYSIKDTDAAAILENDGPVIFGGPSGTSSVQLGNTVQRFTVMPTSPTTTVPQLDIGIQATVDGFAMHTKRTDSTGSLSGILVELDTTLAAGARGGIVISRGAGGGAGGNNSGVVVSGGAGYPFTDSIAGDVALYAEQGGIEFGADAVGFTSATRVTPSNHWAQTVSVGAPTLDAGCTSGGGSAIVGNDNAFKVTTGATSTACTVTFKKTWTLDPICDVRGNAGATHTESVTATAVTFSANQSAKVYDVICQGQPGST